ncbi:MAG TPA: 2-phospho-L-lactate transferase [Actinobacteria bacterium]|nr:2-phospho-L-lactate transferase [Actinomycetota bacterium]
MTTKVVLLSGGVGGARLARGFEQISEVDLTVIVNVGDDDRFYGLDVSPDLDTMLYTLAGVEGGEGWGRQGDSLTVMEHLTALGADTQFEIGDADLAVNLYRTERLRRGDSLAGVTDHLSSTLGINALILPTTNERVETKVKTDDGWLGFQEYFVMRGHRDEVLDVKFDGAGTAEPCQGVIEAVRAADAVVIGPSNPPLSIWPILAVAKVSDAIAQARRVVAVSPLIGGRPIKGPADRVLLSLGFSPGNVGVLEAYDDLVDDLVIDTQDGHERSRLTERGVSVHVGNTRIAEPESAATFARWMLEFV